MKIKRISIFVTACGAWLTSSKGVALPEPAWWTAKLSTTDPEYPSGYPAVWNQSATEDNRSIANVGQAKWVAFNALETIRGINPVVAAQIEEELVGVGKPIADWEPPASPEERALNHGPLLLGQLKAIALPFYNGLNLAARAWLLREIQRNQGGSAVLGSNYWEAIGVGGYVEGGYFPWNPSTMVDVNLHAANIGQLKAVFALQFNTLPLTALAYGRVGGASGMNLWAPTGLYDNTSTSATNDYHNNRDPGSGVKYTVNPDLWCKSLMPQLTGLVVAKDDCGTSWGAAGASWRARYGGVAITKRHVLCCSHSHTHAQGTWINGNTTNTPPTRLRFIDTNGNAIDRVQLHQGAAGLHYSNFANDYGAHLIDLSVAVLDQDLPDNVHIFRIIPARTLSQIMSYDMMTLSQEWQPASASEQLIYGPYTPSSNYPSTNRQMVHLSGPSIWSASGSDPLRQFSYSVWRGDSGTPLLTLAGGEVLVAGIVSGGPIAQAVDGWTGEDRLNALIAVADANAIALGRMASPTGYTVQLAPASLFP